MIQKDAIRAEISCGLSPIVYYEKKYTVPGRCCAIIPRVTDLTLNCADMITEPCETALPIGFLLAPCIVKCKEGSKVVGMELQNLSQKAISIP